MKVKLDENLGLAATRRLRAAGCDVATGVGQGLTSAPDARVIEVCRQESRCLVTLDLDFSNPLLFNPADYSGIAVLRLPPKPGMKDLLDAADTLARALAEMPVEGKLWVVQRGRVRVHEPPD